MDERIQVVAIVGEQRCSLFLVFELVRRRRLIERYALLWLLSPSCCSCWRPGRPAGDGLPTCSGSSTPSNALFVVAFAFVLLLLLHFSLAISRLSDETKVLAQQVARLDREVRVLKHQEQPDAEEPRSGARHGGRVPRRPLRRGGSAPRGSAQQQPHHHQ